MISITTYDPKSPYCPDCGIFTNSTLEYHEDEDGEDILMCPFCGYEDEEE